MYWVCMKVTYLMNLHSFISNDFYLQYTGNLFWKKKWSIFLHWWTQLWNEEVLTALVITISCTSKQNKTNKTRQFAKTSALAARLALLGAMQLRWNCQNSYRLNCFPDILLTPLLDFSSTYIYFRDEWHLEKGKKLVLLRN